MGRRRGIAWRVALLVPVFLGAASCSQFPQEQKMNAEFLNAVEVQPGFSFVGSYESKAELHSYYVGAETVASPEAVIDAPGLSLADPPDYLVNAGNRRERYVGHGVARADSWRCSSTLKLLEPAAARLDYLRDVVGDDVLNDLGKRKVVVYKLVIGCNREP